MNNNLTDITVLLDRSGSMRAIRDDMIGGLNQVLDTQRALPGQATFTLAIFDHEYTVARRTADLKEVPPLTAADLVPRGSTALLDAMGRCIIETGERLAAMPEPDRPARVLFVVITDGLENASREYTPERVRAMTRHQSEQYSWEFVYLGANQDAFHVASQLGIPAGNTKNFEATKSGTATASAELGLSAGTYRSADYIRGHFFAPVAGSKAAAEPPA